MADKKAPDETPTQTEEQNVPETREEAMYREMGIGESERITVYIPKAKGEEALPIGLNGRILMYKREETHRVPKEIFDIMKRAHVI